MKQLHPSLIKICFKILNSWWSCQRWYFYFLQQVNPVNEPSSDRASLTIAELRSVIKDNNPALGSDVIQLTFAFDFYGIDNPIYHKKGLYGFLQGMCNKVSHSTILHVIQE